MSANLNFMHHRQVVPAATRFRLSWEVHLPQGHVGFIAPTVARASARQVLAKLQASWKSTCPPA